MEVSISIISASEAHNVPLQFHNYDEGPCFRMCLFICTVKEGTQNVPFYSRFQRLHQRRRCMQCVHSASQFYESIKNVIKRIVFAEKSVFTKKDNKRLRAHKQHFMFWVFLGLCLSGLFSVCAPRSSGVV